MVTTKKVKKSTKKSATLTRGKVETGPVPPYSEVIRGAITRGDKQEMKSAAASARKWIADVQSALAQLESAMKK